MFNRIRDWWQSRSSGTAATSAAPWWRIPAIVSGTIALFVFLVVCWYWSREPKVFWVEAQVDGETATVGFATTSTLIRVTGTLLDKPGGLLINDIAPPGLVLDNIPSWEVGVLTQVRDLSRVMRNDYSRSQSQSNEDEDLADAESHFYIDYNSWIFPAAESEYREGIEALERYQARLLDTGAEQSQFFARADNLREWLGQVEKRLGNMSQALTASVGQARVNTDLAGDASARSGGGDNDSDVIVKTPWLKIDNVLFEARGTAWALLHFLRAAQFDFEQVLDDKNATVSLRQIIRELEASLEPLASPMVLNGSGYGVFANHSLVMASYLSRANAAVIDLRELLDQG
ncbi:MAG: DUF2333 family protein [Pseudomonadota bacterium]